MSTASEGFRILRDLVGAVAPIVGPFVPPPVAKALEAAPRLFGFAHDLTEEGIDLEQAITRIENNEPLFEDVDEHLRARLRRRWGR